MEELSDLENDNKMYDKEIFNVNPKELSNCIFRDKNIYARVYSVYDGDTISVIFKFNDEFIKYSCRIIEIDTPELRTKNKEEKKLGIEARDYLRSLILDKIVKLNVLNFDKYGRLLVRVFTDNNEDISKLMISGGYAKMYYGGKKSKWCV